MSVRAEAPDPDSLSVFAAIRSRDAALTIIAVRKSATDAPAVSIGVASFAGGPVAQVWQLSSPGGITRLADAAVSGDSLLVSLPARSVTLFVLPAAGLVLSEVSPAFGPAIGGTPLRLSGAGFAGDAAVSVGGAPATAVTAADANKLHAATAGHVPGPADVRVMRPVGSLSTLAKAFFYDFTDVPPPQPFHDSVVRLSRNGITSGCGGGAFCPDEPVSRAQMAIFLLRSEHGSAYHPLPATGTRFADVPASAFAADWIEQLSAEGITFGCGGGNYCSTDAVTRGPMAGLVSRAFELP